VADAPDAIFGLPLSPGERLVLVLLWRYAPAGTERPIVWPGAARLADVTGFSERAVRRMLADLRRAGAIERCTRPAAAMASGKAWRLNPDPSVTLTERSPDPPAPPTVTDGSRSPCPVGHPDPSVTLTKRPPLPGPSGPPPPDPPVRLTLTERPPRSPIEAPEESPGEAPPVTAGFALHPAPVKAANGARARGKPPTGCTDHQWAQVAQAYAAIREIGGLAPQWGRYLDNATNRAIVGRIYRDGYTDQDVAAVAQHIGERLRDGSFGDPKWAGLEYVARAVRRYLDEIATRPTATLAAPRQRTAATASAPAPLTYYPEPEDDCPA